MIDSEAVAAMRDTLDRQVLHGVSEASPEERHDAVRVLGGGVGE